MHRLILLSDTYQRASDHPSLPDVKVKDPNGDLFAYFPPRRMEAEELRDSILFVSGELSSDAGGPGTFPQINEDVARQPLHRMGSIAPAYLPSAKKSERNRRSIYMFQQRSLIDPMVEVFNGPNLDISCERRDAATIPTQAFTLWNSQFSQDMALALAMRAGEGAASVTQQITRAFQLAFGRNPEAKELQLAIAHYNKQVKHHRSTPPAPRPKAKPVIHMLTSELTGEKFEFLQQGDPQPYEHNTHLSEVSPEARALADLALVLLNSNEFIYVY